MLKIITAISLALALTACTKQPTPADVSAEATNAVASASEVVAIYDTPPDTSDEWVPTNAQEDLSMSADDWEREFQDSVQPDQQYEFQNVEHFKVMRQIEVYQGQDAITIQKISDTPMTVSNIIINRGNCGLLSKPNPKNLPYSGKMTVHLWGCNALDVLEVEVVTEHGGIVYTF